MKIEYGEPTDRTVAVDGYVSFSPIANGLAVERVTLVGDGSVKVILAGSELAELTIKSPEYRFPFPLLDMLVGLQSFGVEGKGQVVVTQRRLVGFTGDIDITRKEGDRTVLVEEPRLSEINANCDAVVEKTKELMNLCFAFPIYRNGKRLMFVAYNGMGGILALPDYFADNDTPLCFDTIQKVRDVVGPFRHPSPPRNVETTQ